MKTNIAAPSVPLATAPTPVVEQPLATYLLGMMQGALRFHQMHGGQGITEAQVYDLLATTITDATHPSVWNAGYVMGWTRAFHQCSVAAPPPKDAAEERARQDEVARLLEHVRQGEMTLREAANTVDDLLLL